MGCLHHVSTFTHYTALQYSYFSQSLLHMKFNIMHIHMYVFIYIYISCYECSIAHLDEDLIRHCLQSAWDSIAKQYNNYGSLHHEYHRRESSLETVTSDNKETTSATAIVTNTHVVYPLWKHYVYFIFAFRQIIDFLCW